MNKFPGFCTVCKRSVGAGHGDLSRSASGAWGRCRPKPGGWAERRPKPSHSIEASSLLGHACMRANGIDSSRQVDALVAETAAAIRSGAPTEAPTRVDLAVAEAWAWRIREITHTTAAEAREAHSLGVLIPTDLLDVCDATKLERYLGKCLWGKGP